MSNVALYSVIVVIRLHERNKVNNDFDNLLIVCHFSHKNANYFPVPDLICFSIVYHCLLKKIEYLWVLDC